MNDIDYDKVLKSNVITITLKGKRYTVSEPSLERILAFQRESEKINEVKDVAEAAMQIKRVIRTVYTDIPEKALDDYSPKILYRILADVTSIVKDSMLPEFTKEVQEPKEKVVKKGKKKMTTTS
jgi:hypothetical protein